MMATEEDHRGTERTEDYEKMSDSRDPRTNPN